MVASSAIEAETEKVCTNPPMPEAAQQTTASLQKEVGGEGKDTGETTKAQIVDVKDVEIVKKDLDAGGDLDSIGKGSENI